MSAHMVITQRNKDLKNKDLQDNIFLTQSHPSRIFYPDLARSPGQPSTTCCCPDFQAWCLMLQPVNGTVLAERVCDPVATGMCPQRGGFV